jgi:hypothetical protein
MSTNFNYAPRHGYDNIDPEGTLGRHRAAAVADAPAASRYDDISKPVQPYRPRVGVQAEATPIAPSSPEVHYGAERAETFAEAAQQVNELSESTILKMVNGELSGTGDSDVGEIDIKLWADRVEADKESLDLAADPVRIAELHAKTSAMIGRNQRIVTNNAILDGRVSRHLQKLASDYRDELQDNDGVALRRAIMLWDNSPPQYA